MARTHQARFPDHVLVFACNTAEERDRLVARGLDARLLNKNCIVSEETFRPLEGIEPEFDAVCNARFEPFKRHHLAGGIDSVAYLSFDNPVSTADTRQAQRQLLAELLAGHPGHVLINPVEDGLPVRLPAGEVNAALNRAAVGLCLSGVEGTNYASMEYPLAGLPVVSTPSIGGRDHYFDPEYCTICDPDPTAVREAVEALRSRHIPRRTVREATLARIEPDRQRLLTLIDDLSERLGGKRRYDEGVAAVHHRGRVAPVGRPQPTSGRVRKAPPSRAGPGTGTGCNDQKAAGGDRGRPAPARRTPADRRRHQIHAQLHPARLRLWQQFRLLGARQC
jgi:glycosyltransferase involved in cell wall biosynthesis